jgi:hypothetical protein
MFIMVTKSKAILSAKNEAALNDFLSRVAIEDWPTVIFKQIDRNNLRRMATSFDRETNTFTHRPMKVSK